MLQGGQAMAPVQFMAAGPGGGPASPRSGGAGGMPAGAAGGPAAAMMAGPHMVAAGPGMPATAVMPQPGAHWVPYMQQVRSLGSAWAGLGLAGLAAWAWAGPCR